MVVFCNVKKSSWQHRIKRVHGLGYLLRNYWSDALNGFYSIKIRSNSMKNDLLSSKQEKKSKTFRSDILILMLDTGITTERKSQSCTLISWTLKHEIWGWQFLFIYLQFLGQKLASYQLLPQYFRNSSCDHQRINYRWLRIIKILFRDLRSTFSAQFYKRGHDELDTLTPLLR